VGLSSRTIGSNTLIAVRIHVVYISNVRLVSSNDVDCAVFRIDRRDRSYWCDTRRIRIEGHGVQL
jgi:hypothetical protein